MGMLTDRVGLTGQTMVSKKQEKVEPLTFCQVLKTAYKGQWLTLEDDIGSIRDALITEQVNIGLLSALILTITFAYQFEVQGLDWDYIELQWGPTNASTVNMAFRGKASALSGQEMVRIHRDLLSCISMFSTFCFVLSTVHCVLTIIKVGELTAATEPRQFAEKLGFVNSAGLLFFLLGASFLIIFNFYHFFIFCSYVQTMVVGIVVSAVLTCVYVFGVQFRQQARLRRVCITAHAYADPPHGPPRAVSSRVPQVALFAIKARSYRTLPRTLSTAELDAHALAFCRRVGPQHMDIGVFEEFVRDRTCTEGDGGASAIVFSVGTRKAMGVLATKVSDAYVLATLAQSRLVEHHLETHAGDSADARLQPRSDLHSALDDAIASRAGVGEIRSGHQGGDGHFSNKVTPRDGGGQHHLQTC